MGGNTSTCRVSPGGDASTLRMTRMKLRQGTPPLGVSVCESSSNNSICNSSRNTSEDDSDGSAVSSARTSSSRCGGERKMAAASSAASMAAADGNVAAGRGGHRGGRGVRVHPLLLLRQGVLLTPLPDSCYTRTHASYMHAALGRSRSRQSDEGSSAKMT